MPEPYRVSISPEASADLQALHGFIAQDSPDSAARMVERILSAIGTLSSFPHRTVIQYVGRRLKQPVRSVAVKPYVIYFRAYDDDGVIRILTIRHGARRRPRGL
jgi:plasmid stabilization system protein ParE